MARVLPDRELRALLNTVIINGSPDSVRVNSYKVRLGHTACFNSTGEQKKIPEGHYLEIEPGDFVTIESLERFDFSTKTLESVGKPNGIFAWITPTTTMMREGFLFASTKVDVGYRGTLNWGIRNSSVHSIKLKQGERLFKLTLMELGPDEAPEAVYGDKLQDQYQDTKGIRPSARMIEADVSDRLLVRRSAQKIDPLKQLTQAGYPFNHIGTELVALQGRFEIVSHDVALVKNGFDNLREVLEKKIDKETTALSTSISGLADQIDTRMRSTFGQQFGLYFDQRMQRVYGTVATIVTLAFGLYKLVIQSAPSRIQGWALIAIGMLLWIGTMLVTRPSLKK